MFEGIFSSKNFDREYDDIMQVKNDGTSIFSSVNTLKNSKSICHSYVKSLTISIIISVISMFIAFTLIDKQGFTREFTFAVEGILGLLIVPGTARQVILLLESCKALRAMKKFYKHKDEFDNAFNSFNNFDGSL